jgi:ATP-dependent exoDNAse (exonuclease V) beta subunit
VDAVRLMTIHRAKGLEFDVVCVADLGRGPRYPAEILRVGRDGRFGLRLSEPGTSRPVPALDYLALGVERSEAEAREERRLFYVAMTRAKERLILSGAARVEACEGVPIAWIAPAVLPNISDRLAERSGVSEHGVRFSFVGEEEIGRPEVEAEAGPRRFPIAPAPAPASELVPAERRAQVTTLSYSSLGEYQRCGYRFYAERVLGLPRTAGRGGGPGAARTGGVLSANERGVVIHALLERLDFRRPIPPTAAAVAAACRRQGIAAPSRSDVEDLAALIEVFAAGELCRRLSRATQVRREQRFRFLLEDAVLVTGALDVLAREPGRMLVVDYKSDRLGAAAPGDLVASQYATQRLIYALAVLRSGASNVEVAHVFLERPDEPVTLAFARGDMPQLDAELAGLAEGVLDRRFTVTDTPHRQICDGCPAEGGLCSWPLAMTRREAADRLF